jgi:hypothetical protein
MDRGSWKCSRSRSGNALSPGGARGFPDNFTHQLVRDFTCFYRPGRLLLERRTKIGLEARGKYREVYTYVERRGGVTQDKKDMRLSVLKKTETPAPPPRGAQEGPDPGALLRKSVAFSLSPHRAWRREGGGPGLIRSGRRDGTAGGKTPTQAIRASWVHVLKVPIHAVCICKHILRKCDVDRSGFH